MKKLLTTVFALTLIVFAANAQKYAYVDTEYIMNNIPLYETAKQQLDELGMLFAKRKELLKPIQDDIFNAVKEIAQEGNYAVIFDTANSLNMLYTDPKYDKSDEVLTRLGYKN